MTPRITGAGRAGIGLLVLAWVGSAAAMTVTAPTGATLPKAAPIVVNWVSTPGPGAIEIRLERNTPTFQTYIVASAAPNTGQATVSFPAAWPCSPSATYRIRVFRYQSTATSWTPLDQGYGPVFRFSCGGKPGGGVSVPAPIQLSPGAAVALEADGELKVIKQVVNTTRFPTPASQFKITVACTTGPGAVFTPSAPAGMNQVMTIAAGAQCTVTEADPPLPPRPCRWVISYPGGRTGRDGATLIVRNTLVCGPDTGGAGPR